MRRLLKTLSLILVLVALAASPVFANIQTESINKSTGYKKIISDEAGLFDENSDIINDINGYMNRITAYGNAGIITVSRNYEDTASYAKEVYRSWFGTDSGILFMIDMDNRELYIYCDGKINKTISRKVSLTITDNAYTYASKGDYMTCASKVMSQAATKLEGGKIAQPMRYLSAFFLAVLMALTMTFILAKKFNQSTLADETEILKDVQMNRSFKDVRRKRIDRKITHISRSSGGGGGGGGFGGGGGGSSGSGGGHGF